MMMQFEVSVYILIWFCLKTFLKINIFLYKTNDYRYTFAMGYLAPGEMFDNMLQLICISVDWLALHLKVGSGID